MVSYYNHPFAMYQKNSGGSNLPYSASPSAAAWYSTNYHHQPPNAAQFLGDSDAPPQPVYYPHHVFHQSSPDWAGHENYAAPPQTNALLQGPGSLPGNNGGPAGFLSINQATQNGSHASANEHISDGLQSLPSPPITVSGSDMSSPGANGSSSPQLHSRPTPVKSPYEWMKKPSYQSQPNPGKKSIKFSVFVSILSILVIDHPHKGIWTKKLFEHTSKKLTDIVWNLFEQSNFEKKNCLILITLKRFSELKTSWRNFHSKIPKILSFFL